MADSKELIKYGLIGAAGYYLYVTLQDKFNLPKIPNLFAFGNQLQSGSAPANGGGQLPSGSAPTSAIDLKSRMMVAAGTDLLNADGWGYYYAQVRGVAAPDPMTIWPSRDRGYRMTVEEYLAGTGLTGLGSITKWKHDPAYLKMPAPLGSRGRY